MLFHKKERGQGMVEYALIILFIAIAVILVLTLFGTTLSDTYTSIVNNPAWPGN